MYGLADEPLGSIPMKLDWQRLNEAAKPARWSDLRVWNHGMTGIGIFAYGVNLPQ